VEPANPGFQATIVGVDVLNVESPVKNALPLLYVDGSMHDAGCSGKGLIDAGAVSTQNGIRIDQWAEDGEDMSGIQFFQPEIGSLTTSVAHDQHGNLIGARSPSSPNASALACSTRQFTLSLEGFEEEGFVRFNNPAFMFGTMAGYLMKKAVTPEECRVFVDATPACRCSYTHPVNQGLAVAYPLLTLTQVSQGRAAQWVTGPAATMTTVARQTMTLAPRAQFIRNRLTMRALHRTSRDLTKSYRKAFRTRPLQRLMQRLAPSIRQQRESL